MKVFRKSGNELELLYRQYWQQTSLNNLNKYNSPGNNTYFSPTWNQNSQNIPDSLEQNTKPTDSSAEKDKDIDTTADEPDNN